jgi:23S rRNA G2069 N7-methylase RlmK/C1962 C5-methylase RlmI
MTHVDAYLLESQDWMLFAIISDPALVDDKDYWLKLANDFSKGKVAFISRALKTEKKSEALPPIAIGSSDVPAEVVAIERHELGDLKFRLETSQVLNPGLFLDQRRNRDRLMEYISRANGKGAVLNLFSYTGAFSVAARRAGAEAITSIDVSSRYLGWEKKNFEINFGAEAETSVSHRVIAEDARDYVRRAVRRGDRYRWIILDPPTFSRGKGKVFQVKRDFVELVRETAQLLEPQGAILASNNDAGWSEKAFYEEMAEFARESRLQLERGKTAEEFGKSHPLKSVWLSA